MLSFLNNHLPVLMAARIDATDVVFSEASFKSGVGGGGGGAVGPGAPPLSSQTGRFFLCKGVSL